MQAVVFGVKGYTPTEQIVFINPIGTLAIISLFRPNVTAAGVDSDQVPYSLQQYDVVDVVDIGTRDPITKMFSRSILHNATPRETETGNNVLRTEDISTPFLPLRNVKRLRVPMEL
jgi:hypothetical protein